MKAFTALMMTCVLHVSSRRDGVFAQNVTTEHLDVVTPAQKAMIDAKKVGDMCIKTEQCTNNLGVYVECKMGTCACTGVSQNSGDGSKCEMERSFSAQEFASMMCFVLSAVLHTAL